jgi:hypothetical protein
MCGFKDIRVDETYSADLPQLTYRLKSLCTPCDEISIAAKLTKEYVLADILS